MRLKLHSGSFRNSRLAFTLIELLVAIALIGILTALLAPALTRGKSSAQRVKCVSNLRQLGLAAHLYWDDNNGNCIGLAGWERAPKGSEFLTPGQGCSIHTSRGAACKFAPRSITQRPNSRSRPPARPTATAIIFI